MPLCDICEEEVSTVTKCGSCGNKFCIDCGDPEIKLCLYCQEEDE